MSSVIPALQYRGTKLTRTAGTTERLMERVEKDIYVES